MDRVTERALRVASVFPSSANGLPNMQERGPGDRLRDRVLQKEGTGHRELIAVVESIRHGFSGSHDSIPQG